MMKATSILESASDEEEESGKPSKSEFLDSLDFDEDESTSRVCPSQLTLPRSKVNLLLLGMGAVVIILFFSLLVMVIASSSSKPADSNEVDDGNDQVPDPQIDQDLYRLPKTVVPSSYVLFLEPDFVHFSFSGKVAIEVEVSEPSKYIVLNSYGLILDNVIFEPSSSSSQIKSTILNYDEIHETVNMTFAQEIQAGEGTLHMNFQGELTDNMRGFYRSSYKDLHDKEKVHWIASTQFEATDARRAFPCFDEPDFKAKFTISISVADHSMIALSNMPANSIDNSAGDGGSVIYSFEKSYPMSTYLVCFIVGKFEKVSAQIPVVIAGDLNEKKNRQENEIDNNIVTRNKDISYFGKVGDMRNISVYTIPELAEQGRFALDVACQVIPFYEELFQIQYPMGKLDMVAIPDFAAGAMENWGLVTYRQVDLLLDPKTASESSSQRVAIVVAHELAHQWFGNLVTGEWWGSLWLHEGFATFFESVSLDSLPISEKWQMRDQMIFDQQSAMERDYQSNSHPLEWYPATPDMISEMFDTITYEKGGSVLMQAEAYLGSDVFFEGLRIYLSTHKFQNTKSEDLWAALDLAYNNAQSRSPENERTSLVISENVRKVMERKGSLREREEREMGAKKERDMASVLDKMAKWTYSAGFPVLDIFVDSLKSEWDIHQSRFSDEEGDAKKRTTPISLETQIFETRNMEKNMRFSNDDSYFSVEKREREERDDDLWWIPLWSLDHDGKSGLQELTEERTVISVKDKKEGDWVKYNAGQKGLYRVNYENRNWLFLQRAIAANHTVLGELDRAGLINDALVLARKGRTSYSIALGLLGSILDGEDSYLVWGSAMSELVSIGYLLRDQPCYGDFEKFMQQMIENALDQIAPEEETHTQQLLLSLLNQAGVAFRSPSIVDKLVALFGDIKSGNDEAIDTDLRQSIYEAVVQSGDQDEYETIRDMYVTTTDAIEHSRLLRSLCKTLRRHLIQSLLIDSLDSDVVRPQDRYIVYSYLAKNPNGDHISWDFFRENFEAFNERGFGIGSMIRRITRYFASQTRYDEVESFFAENPPHGGAMSVQASLETIQSNMKWIEDNAETVCDWFKPEH